mmetsp:Transcript_17832/g.41187  ORF Transcript_17832/g.41187 Transcript_17832/m.41187 type:complete len:205 (-) Transcript_17832:480-1094(-)
MTSRGESKSTSALMLYPVVHLMLNFFLISATSSGSALTLEAMLMTPSISALCETWNEAQLAGSCVSSTVPSCSTIRMSDTVWYVFCATPQHIPELLLATTPPIQHDSIDDGSGPSLRAYGASIRFTWPRIQPGSTVILLPSSEILRYLHVWPSLRRMESVIACPDREVPPARNVIGVLFLRAARISFTISSSLWTLTTILGTRR